MAQAPSAFWMSEKLLILPHMYEKFSSVKRLFRVARHLFWKSRTRPAGLLVLGKWRSQKSLKLFLVANLIVCHILLEETTEARLLANHVHLISLNGSLICVSHMSQIRELK